MKEDEEAEKLMEEEQVEDEEEEVEKVMQEEHVE